MIRNSRHAASHIHATLNLRYAVSIYPFIPIDYMIWLLVLIVISTIGGVFGYVYVGKTDDPISGVIDAGIKCAYIMLQIFLGMMGIAFVLVIGNWLLG